VLIALVVAACQAGPAQRVQTAQAVPVGLAPSPASPTLPTAGAGGSDAGPANLPASPIPTAQRSARPSLPPTKDGPVPADLQPSLLAAADDYPRTFADGCNVPEAGTASRGTCLYGSLTSKVTIALFGDSHAAFWFPAAEGFAQRQRWHGPHD
jgi:hypothetical protein